MWPPPSYRPSIYAKCWPAAAGHSVQLTWGSVHPPTASPCSPADCWGQEAHFSPPSPAPPGPGLALWLLPVQHTVEKYTKSKDKSVRSIIDLTDYLTDQLLICSIAYTLNFSDNQTSMRCMVHFQVKPNLTAISSSSGQIFCSIVQNNLWPCANVNFAKKFFCKKC